MSRFGIVTELYTEHPLRCVRHMVLQRNDVCKCMTTSVLTRHGRGEGRTWEYFTMNVKVNYCAKIMNKYVKKDLLAFVVVEVDDIEITLPVRLILHARHGHQIRAIGFAF